MGVGLLNEVLDRGCEILCFRMGQTVVKVFWYGIASCDERCTSLVALHERGVRFLF